MATIQKRKSRGKTYWYLVESRRVNGKPRPIMLAYLGKAEDLLLRLTAAQSFEVKSYSHGDSLALLRIAETLDIVGIINKHIPQNKEGQKPMRDSCTVGASFLLAAIGRACHPTSKLGWYDWCKNTSLEFCLKTPLNKLDSQHFWDQMNALPSEAIPLIENEIVQKLIATYQIKLDCLFFDTTNFFTFIASDNKRCDLPQRGKNKQHRYDLRQVSMALLVSRQEHFPLFHHTYRGNKNDGTLFREVFEALVKRIKTLSSEISDITIVFDKGNNTKANFKLIDEQEGLQYVGGLISSYFKDLILEANLKFQPELIGGEQVPVYRIKREIWGKDRTCIILISAQLLEGQIRGIHQHLDKKFKILEKLKQQLEESKSRKSYDEQSLSERLKKIIKGQFIDEIVRIEIFRLQNGKVSFSYSVDHDAFEKLKKEVLGRRILVTSRDEWNSEEIILAYRGQSNVEFAFKDLKNPFHLAIRPQYHWTDQKIEAHFSICMIGYLLTVAAYHQTKKQAGYKKNINNFLEDLRSIRLASIIEKKPGKDNLNQETPNIKFRLETIPPELRQVAETLRINNENLRSNIRVGVYTS